MMIKGFILSRRFEKQYSKLDETVKKAFKTRKNILMQSSTHPLLNNHKLHGDLSDHWSINITGDYRAVYKLVNTIAIFVAIGTHSELYD